jgi:hypothetical protein
MRLAHPRDTAVTTEAVMVTAETEILMADSSTQSAMTGLITSSSGGISPAEVAASALPVECIHLIVFVRRRALTAI